MKLKSLIGAALLSSCIAFNAYADRINVLMYHAVGDKASRFCVSKDNFEKQLTWLKENYEIVKLSELKENSTCQVVLTFDDIEGKNFYNHAFPILKKHNAKADIYTFTRGISSLKTLKELAKSELIEAGSHSITHRDFKKLGEYMQYHEVTYSKILLEEKLGVKISSFAFPYGKYTETAVKYGKKAGYSLFLTTDSRYSKWPDKIGRVDIDGFWDFDKFKRVMRKEMR
jgi:peptidoglycan/xylan/chitin deacetylase (PgdA/CDA1 family)